MSEAKATIIRILQNMPDDTLDEMEIIKRLYMLVRLENSRKKCDSLFPSLFHLSPTRARTGFILSVKCLRVN